MYFQIENTPEHIRRSRCKEKSPREGSFTEDCPRLILAPFTKPPLVVFENVVIGTTREKSLELFNPAKQIQQITLVTALPPGLHLHMPEECLTLEPETCYSLVMTWTPLQPTALRETIRFVNANRGRYDVIVVLKSSMKKSTIKTPSGKIMKKSNKKKKSPVAIYKKQADVIYKSSETKKTVNIMENTSKIIMKSNKENILFINDYSLESRLNNCPFKSPASVEFDTSEIFSKTKPNSEKIHQTTYEKPYTVSNNVLTPSNQLLNASDLFDNLTFTPLKTMPVQNEKLDKGPKIILSMNSESEFEDSIDMKQSSKENSHNIVFCINAAEPNKRCLIEDQHPPFEQQYCTETPSSQNKKLPATSSPGELSPNFSINTELSRISELSFLPQKFSTEKKVLPKINIETETNLKMKCSSDTYTKDSPNTPLECHGQIEDRPPLYFSKDYPRMCRQSLFQQQKDYHDRNFPSMRYNEYNVCPNDFKLDISTSPRSITPPLQSIPEESTQIHDTVLLEKTNEPMTTFTINRTFNKTLNKSTINQTSWSKKGFGVDAELWKVPLPYKKSLKPIKKANLQTSKIGDRTYETNDSIRNISISQIENVYSQSLTVDPFLSTTYFYDEDAVSRFEVEFKRWLNYILTPPADLDSNIEQKPDFGKAWIENKNKEVPAAPTKEQVSNIYHNSHRLESLRRSARNMFLSPDIQQVFQKLYAQIEKKLISVRTDRNLHLDIGLQKVIMELLLSYNPLWLRIGLEAIYGFILPLKSNSDIEGLTTFIIQRLFKNPFLRNKNVKSNVPNKLLPAYMEAIKKFTLKKFFCLVFFLDQAKQKKLIAHDPCLFCRNAICKESREIIIRFTREMIAGIGDITKHLRPLGYVVSHKQSYLDEYKYAVHNIAVDVRDGVRLTKVMEIILLKHGLLNQLRAPAISRLQKIHNVKVALNALKEANYMIIGDITPSDIADGHREKTLSLLWQIIHVFRAPLFVRAAGVIQIWWRKKYALIVEKRKEEQRRKQKLNNAAAVIQCWWRRIQYNRMVEWKMQQVIISTIVIQKYFRMWQCKNRLTKIKQSVIMIEEWYRSLKLIKESRVKLMKLRQDHEKLRHQSAVVIQSYVRRWMCMKRYKCTLKYIITAQSLVRKFLIRKSYLSLKMSISFIQHKYRANILMKSEMHRFKMKRASAIVLQSYIRMMLCKNRYRKLKKSVRIIEEHYLASIKMRNERSYYFKLKQSVVYIQSLCRRKQCRLQYLKKRYLIIKIQQKIRAYQLMKKQSTNYHVIRNAVITLQKHSRAYLAMKRNRQEYISLKSSATLIQKYFRSYLLTKVQRHNYIKLRKAAIVLQIYYKNLLIMRLERNNYIELRKRILTIQRWYKAQILMRKIRNSYLKLRSATIVIQVRFRAQLQMHKSRSEYVNLKKASIVLANVFRTYTLTRILRADFVKKKICAIIIQRWYRNRKKGMLVQQSFQQMKAACITIQAKYRAYILGTKCRKEFIQIKSSIICIQKYYKCYLEMKMDRQYYFQLKTATVTIQRHFKLYLEVKKAKEQYLRIKAAISLIQKYYRQYKESKIIRHKYCLLKNAVLFIQSKYRSICSMRKQREHYLKLKNAACIIQMHYKALISMKKDRQAYLKLRKVTITVQKKIRATHLMQKERKIFIRLKNASICIQRFYRTYKLGIIQRMEYLSLKKAAMILQCRYRAILSGRKDRASYLSLLSATIIIQRRFKANRLMLDQKSKYGTIMESCITIQRTYKAYKMGKKKREEYLKIKSAVIFIQNRFRATKKAKEVRDQYLRLIKVATFVQRQFRSWKLSQQIKREESVSIIQKWYRSILVRNHIRTEFLKVRKCATTIQSTFRMHITRKGYINVKIATLTIQRYYRAYKLCKVERLMFINRKHGVIKVQNLVRSFLQRSRYLKLRKACIKIQLAYRYKKLRDVVKYRREVAAVTIQKNIRRYLAQSKYRNFRKQIIFIQKTFKGILVTRLMRCDFLQRRRTIIKLQALIRGYLLRKQMDHKKEVICKQKEEQRQHLAATKIQALYRSYKAWMHTTDKRVTELRQRWKTGGLQSTQKTIKERNDEAIYVICEYPEIKKVIMAFKTIEYCSEVYPMLYDDNARHIVRSVHIYMSTTNRSITSVVVLKYAAAILVNLARYRVTGPNIYCRDHIEPILKFMLRFMNTEVHLFCLLSTYLWLFSKYDNIREDLSEYLRLDENHKMMVTIKENVLRYKKMTSRKKKCVIIETSSLPALDPDYGICKVNQPRYFEDLEFAIVTLFATYNL